MNIKQILIGAPDIKSPNFIKYMEDLDKRLKNTENNLNSLKLEKLDSITDNLGNIRSGHVDVMDVGSLTVSGAIVGGAYNFMVGGSTTGTYTYGGVFNAYMYGTTSQAGLLVSAVSAVAPSSTIYGIISNPLLRATTGGPVAALVAGHFAPQLDIGCAINVTSAIGVYAKVLNQSIAPCTITDAYGLYSANPYKWTGDNHITNAYGLYIENINNGETLNYAIYTNAGLVRIGSTVCVAGDGGGLASTVGFTNAVSGVSTGVGNVKTNGTTARDSTGWIKIYDGINARYIPFWTTITG